jgi:hypothetical protein
MNTKLLGVIVASALFNVFSPAYGDQYTYTTIFDPLAVGPGAYTEALGINNRGQIVGQYGNNSVTYGFQSWSRLFEQFFRFDKWSLCRG